MRSKMHKLKSMSNTTNKWLKYRKNNEQYCLAFHWNRKQDI